MCITQPAFHSVLHLILLVKVFAYMPRRGYRGRGRSTASSTPEESTPNPTVQKWKETAGNVASGIKSNATKVMVSGLNAYLKGTNALADKIEKAIPDEWEKKMKEVTPQRSRGRRGGRGRTGNGGRRGY